MTFCFLIIGNMAKISQEWSITAFPLSNPFEIFRQQVYTREL